MTRREMKQRIRELEKRVRLLEIASHPISGPAFEGPYIGFDGKNWTWSAYPPWHPMGNTTWPKPGENGSGHRLAT